MTISLCLIHGWAVNADIFTEFRHMLPENWRISAPHLIGHGSNQESFSVFEAADKIATQLIEPSFLFGWSLGGLVALHVAARYPERVRGLILSNTFARFQAASDYPQGVSLTSLERMVSFFQQDYTQSVRQFLELQFWRRCCPTWHNMVRLLRCNRHCKQLRKLMHVRCCLKFSVQRCCYTAVKTR